MTDGGPNGDPPVPPRILLIGMMGAGKTTVGRALAERLGWSYADVDDLVERRTGRTVPELFAERGEVAFRAEETAALVALAGGRQPTVISVGGGAVLADANRRVLRDVGFVIWLRASVETLARRVGKGEGRPLLTGDPAELLGRLLRQRVSLYEDTAHAVVDVDDLALDEVVERVRVAAGEHACRS